MTTDSFETADTRCVRDPQGSRLLLLTAARPDISSDVLDAVNRALDVAERQATPLVIGTTTEHFAVGANLDAAFRAAAEGRPQVLDAALDRYQQTMLRLRHASVPTVAAVRGAAVSGGCELLMHCTRVVAHARSVIGLAETSIGVIPSGGGLKEFALRAARAGGDLAPRIDSAFDIVAGARLARGADDARMLGYLDADDVIVDRGTLDHARHLAATLMPHRRVLPLDPGLRVTGAEHAQQLIDRYRALLEEGTISAHQFEIGSRVARVLCGGDGAGDERTETDMLALERMHFLVLACTPSTQARIEHLRTTGTVLRN